MRSLHVSPSTLSSADAVRLLQQATFGPTTDGIDEAVALGIDAWIDRQLQAEASLTEPYVRENSGGSLGATRHYIWWKNLGSFQAALDDLGVADSVTTFTASDFGRTLTINGDGTDHGWGGHAFVMGGAVNEGRYGTFPSYSTTNNPDDVTPDASDFAGRLIPTTSVAQYGATLSRWMGLNDLQLHEAFPELANFATNDLGFLSS